MPNPLHREPAHFWIYGDYQGREPAFFAADQFAWSEVLRENWTVFREEFEAWRKRPGNVPKVNVVPDDVELSGWRGVNLFTYLHRHEANCRAFPRTVAILQSIPDLVSAYLNVLEPHSNLPPHFGYTNISYRAHVGLIVPGGVDECGIQVDGERTGWREGEVLVFNDARKHFVWNRSDRERLILVCDILKREYGGALRPCAKVLGAMAIKYLQRWRAVRSLPPAAVRALHGAASLPFYLHLRMFGLSRPQAG